MQTGRRWAMKMISCFHPVSARNRKSSKSTSLREHKPCVSTTSLLSIQDSGDLQLVFDKFDVNGDGRISMVELESMLRCLGFSGSTSEVEAMMQNADADGDGFISLEEFMQLNTQERESSNCMADLRNAFTIFDRDNDGLISATELHQVLTSMGENTTLSACKNMIRGVDVNGDGAVNFQEFIRMMTKSPV